MPRILIPSLGPTDWRRLLADPGKQWKRGRSALELSVSWEAARNSERGLPGEVAQVLDTAEHLQGCELALCVPEHQVQIEGGGHASQNDLWALLRTSKGLASLTLEAKAGEPLDKLVSDWLAEASPTSGKPRRIAALKKLLGVPDEDVGHLRYQLFHRAVSAVLEGARFRTTCAILLIQSFNRAADEGSWNDFVKFSALLGAEAREGGLALATRPIAIPLYLGWVTSEPAGEAKLAAAV